MGQTAAAVADLILNVARRVDGPVEIAQAFFVESAFDSALALPEEAVYFSVHSKSLSAGGDGCSLQHQTPQKHQGFRVFQLLFLVEARRVRLIKA